MFTFQVKKHVKKVTVAFRPKWKWLEKNCLAEIPEGKATQVFRWPKPNRPQFCHNKYFGQKFKNHTVSYKLEFKVVLIYQKCTKSFSWLSVNYYGVPFPNMTLSQPSKPRYDDIYTMDTNKTLVPTGRIKTFYYNISEWLMSIKSLVDAVKYEKWFSL